MLVRIVNGDNEVVTPPTTGAVYIKNQHLIFTPRFKNRRTSLNTLTVFYKSIINITNVLVILCKYFI